MAEPYTAEQFAELAADVAGETPGEGVRSITIVGDDVWMVAAALRIASLVMKPGVIEAECNKPFEPESACLSTTQLAAAIRKALCGDGAAIEQAEANHG